MKDLAYYNGVFTPYDAACIPLSDRSLFFGDAVYDVIIGRGKKVYQLDEHLDRLFLNAERIGLANHCAKTEISEVINILLSEAQAEEFLLYIQLSGNGQRRGHERQDERVNLLISITKCDFPSELSEIKAITLPDMRHGMCDVKTTNLLSAVLSVEEAHRRGADIAIFHKCGTVTECSYANISILKQGMLITHPLDSDILPGITQENLVRAAHRLGIPHAIRRFSVQELHEADAVMITSTTKLIKVCASIDGTPLTTSEYGTVDRLFAELKRDLYDKIGLKSPD